MRAFRQKWRDVLRWEVDDRGGEPFDPSFVQAERVIAFRENETEGGVDYMVKWRNLPYHECTWETESCLEDAMGKREAQNLISTFEAFDRIPDEHLLHTPERPPVPRAKSNEEMRDYASKCTFKDGHMLRESTGSLSTGSSEGGRSSLTRWVWARRFRRWDS